jgi:hypothetical protein
LDSLTLLNIALSEKVIVENKSGNSLLKVKNHALKKVTATLETQNIGTALLNLFSFLFGCFGLSLGFSFGYLRLTLLMSDCGVMNLFIKTSLLLGFFDCLSERGFFGGCGTA